MYSRNMDVLYQYNNKYSRNFLAHTFTFTDKTIKILQCLKRHIFPIKLTVCMLQFKPPIKFS